MELLSRALKKLKFHIKIVFNTEIYLTRTKMSNLMINQNCSFRLIKNVFDEKMLKKGKIIATLGIQFKNQMEDIIYLLTFTPFVSDPHSQ